MTGYFSVHYDHLPATRVSSVDGQKLPFVPNHSFPISFQIGLMRSGRLLAEEAPQVLLSIYSCQSLEEVFLKLSRKQQGTESNNLQEVKANNASLVSIHSWPAERRDALVILQFFSICVFVFVRAYVSFIHLSRHSCHFCSESFAAYKSNHLGTALTVNVRLIISGHIKLV